MSVKGEVLERSANWRNAPAWVVWLVALLGAGALFHLLRTAPALKPLVDYPEGWTIPLQAWINVFMDWLLNEFSFGLFTFKELTRAFAAVLDVPLDILLALLSKGVEVSLLGVGVQLPPLSWVAVTGVLVYASWSVGDRKLAVLMAAALLYLAVFGQWDGAMITLSSVLVAVPLGVVGGLLLGIVSYRSPAFERALTPVLDMMQTVPIFAYLVPVLALFGFGPVAALVATVIYAMPPMVRVTILALKGVPEEVREFGEMVGCSRAQMTWKILVPVARYRLMVGVNQVIMLTLNMVIIASMIGAGGLGYDVLNALRQLEIGESVEAGLAISLIAIAMDRFTRAVTELQPTSDEDTAKLSFAQRHRYVLIALAVLVGTTLAGLIIPGLAPYPAWAQVTTASYWDQAVNWINMNLGAVLYSVKSFMLIFIMIPVKRFLMDVPWVLIVGLVSLAGFRLGGWRLAATVTGFTLFILVTGNWEKGLISVYLTGFAVAIAVILGVSFGVAAAMSQRVHHVAQVIVDVLQTLPAFVYLIPAVMLFQVGEFSALLAIVAYAIAPAIRYTDHGLRGVSPEVLEAATVSGCTRRQKLFKVQLPLAFPDIMLGVNQTIMMGLSMLVITALIGTSDLGQETYIALTKADPGRGLAAGLSVACIAMTADRLIQAAATRRKRELGLA
ncbi:glycine betaine/proline transport system permease protein [Limimonas halophila]|uniref:Glycine betaine/proline transport system permease protein n=1 Tax=Limimonas halophila TaxID=1082479 RepID=A0A1G7LLH2_9PROT|nr:ABC transporter permease subunit [Limimonas halophila]SDF49789.1 glycine betaine/proline transport system permease protein [Limimonas halophila]